MQQRNQQILTSLLLSPLLLAASGYAQTASFTPLGFMDTVNPWSECTGISDDGSLVVGHSRGPNHAAENLSFTWTVATGMIAIANPPLNQGVPSSRATDVSGDGLVLAGDTTFDVFGGTGYTWQSGFGFTPLTPAGDGGYANTSATNGDGSVSVGYTRLGGYIAMITNKEATVWLDDGQLAGHTIGRYPAGVVSTARGVSRDGNVVVGEALRDWQEGQTAFRWDMADGFVSLGDLPGGYHFSRASAASANGDKIVGFGTISFSAGFSVDHRACLWDAQGVHQLPDLAGSGYRSEANDISPDGQFTVGWSQHGPSWVPVIWDDVHGARNIFELMTQAGVDVSSWDSGIATAVSADGKTIVGHGRRGTPFPTTEAWVCTLP
ncbi:MAG: putative membrane protein [Planctomycetota bacterium]|jgi:uncharacterized membrane protein